MGLKKTWTTPTREPILLEAIVELYEFIVTELDPDPADHPADYLTGERSEIVRLLLPEPPKVDRTHHETL